MSKRAAKSHRAWVIWCEGIGPISGTHSSMRRVVELKKQQQYPTNPLYTVQRIRITLDPTARRRARTSTCSGEKNG